MVYAINDDDETVRCCNN